jgi:hypothetical protein
MSRQVTYVVSRERREDEQPAGRNCELYIRVETGLTRKQAKLNAEKLTNETGISHWFAKE